MRQPKSLHLTETLAHLSCLFGTQGRRAVYNVLHCLQGGFYNTNLEREPEREEEQTK